MRVLIGCESSGTVREAFRARGHDAVSCDLLAADDGSPHHIQGCILEACLLDEWDLLIAHPPCTYLSSSGLHWNKRVPGRAEKTEQALAFIGHLLTASAHIKKLAIENPIGAAKRKLGPASQIIHPYQFGADASKATCLWLRGLPKLVPTELVAPRMVMGPSGKPLPRWGNQTDSGQNRLGPSPDRWKVRSRTYNGIAQAMADQWGNV